VRAHVHRLFAQAEFGALETGQGGEVIDEPSQLPALDSEHLPDPLLIILAELPRLESLGVPADRGQGRPQVVAHAQDELALAFPGRLQFGSHLVERPRHLVQLGVGEIGDPCRHVAGGDAAGSDGQRLETAGDLSREHPGQEGGEGHDPDGQQQEPTNLVTHPDHRSLPGQANVDRRSGVEQLNAGRRHHDELVLIGGRGLGCPL
jgi:hypothetical protein